jgi:2-hydroxy-3-oxopropionate reductase
LHIKDLNNVLETSHELGIPLPMSSAVMEMMQALRADGLGQDDHCSIVKYYEKISNVLVGH